MAQKSSAWTPYRYGFNNPLRFIDPTGMQEDDENDQKSGFSDTMNDLLGTKKVSDIIGNIFSTTKESTERAPAVALESVENTVSEIGTAVTSMPAYGLRSLEVSATGADFMSEWSNYIALATLTIGHPEISAGAFTIGRAAALYSLTAKGLLTCANPEQYAREALVQLVIVGTGEYGGRFVFGSAQYNTAAQRFINTQGRFIPTTVGNENFMQKFYLNFVSQYIR